MLFRSKIKGKGSISIDNGRGKAQDVLFVDGLKENLLSVSQMCGKGYEGESSKGKEKENKNIIFVKAKKNDEVAQTIPTKEETYNKEDRDQKKPLVANNVINTKTPEYVKFGNHQRRFFPPIKNATLGEF